MDCGVRTPNFQLGGKNPETTLHIVCAQMVTIRCWCSSASRPNVSRSLKRWSRSAEPSKEAWRPRGRRLTMWPPSSTRSVNVIAWNVIHCLKHNSNTQNLECGFFNRKLTHTLDFGLCWWIIFHHSKFNLVELISDGLKVVKWWGIYFLLPWLWLVQYCYDLIIKKSKKNYQGCKQPTTCVFYKTQRSGEEKSFREFTLTK